MTFQISALEEKMDDSILRNKNKIILLNVKLEVTPMVRQTFIFISYEIVFDY